jgi:hypothetical protein
MKLSSNSKGSVSSAHAEQNGNSGAGSPPGQFDAQLGNRATAALFEEAVGPSGDRFEREADRAATRVSRDGLLTNSLFGGARPAAGSVLRKCADCPREEEEKIRDASKEGEAEPTPEAQPAAETPVAEPAAEIPKAAAAGPALLVDDTEDAAQGQMRKSEFMSTLRGEVCAAADEAMAGSGRDSTGCPYVEYWFDYYGEQDALHVERAIRRYAPEASDAATAADYIGIVTARVRRSVDVWAKTGEITGVPPEAAGGGNEGGGTGTDGEASKKRGLFFKARGGGPRSADPASVRDQLGTGQPLPGTVRTRMESAFGASFAGVRLHTDTKGAALSDQLNARAFTVGQHVAFGPGEFRPGSIAGDALLAHELAHVMQQGGSESMPAMGKAADSAGELEDDADRSATAAVSMLWTRGKGAAAGVARNVLPAIRSGLQLSRCSKTGSAKAGKVKLKSGPTYTPSGTIKATKSGGKKNATFKLGAEFENDPANGIDASAGEVRQYVKWSSAADIPNHAGWTPKSAYSAKTWYEDRDDVGKRYGHRTGTYSECASINHYVDKKGAENCATGEVFDGRDDPMDGSGAKTGTWDFELRAVDTGDSDKQIGTPAQVTVDWNV